MTTTLPETATAYVQAINTHDAAAFIDLFADDAVVDDAGRTFRGLTEIKGWSDHEIFDAQVTLEVLGVAGRDGETVVTAKVDGKFDRTGLPDPLIMDHYIAVAGDKIAGLTCRLAGEKRAT
ncbi:MAG: nuclear transport factor 2 family protein [Gemmataceae bacterium]|nr:nuclear transport factor 2 family protein [Gemmataceae bacterium]